MIEETARIKAILTIRTEIDCLRQVFVTAHTAVLALLSIYDEAVERLTFIARTVALGITFAAILLALLSRELVQSRRNRRHGLTGLRRDVDGCVARHP